MKLRIGHLDYTVRAMDETDAEHGDNYGLCYGRTQQIAVDHTVSSERQLSVLLHEIMHAAWSAYAMPDKANEEHVCSFFGNAFANIFLTNPHLLPVLLTLRHGGKFLEPPA